MKNQKVKAKKILRLKALLAGKSSMLIVMQDYPDPDSIASATALRTLAHAISEVQCFIAYSGVIGRAENQAMVKYLDLNLHPMDRIDLNKFDVVALVDTQPGTGNNPLPTGIVPDIVIDHHPIQPVTRSVGFTDVRSRYGATSTILVEYLKEAGIEPDIPLATALLYGIRSDTHDLGREATQADIDAFLSLYPGSNKRMLSRIERGRVPEEYFQMLAEGLKNARVYGIGIVTGLGDIENPDMIGEVADLLLRNESSIWALCYGFYESRTLFSLRTSDADADAGGVARRIVKGKGTGGGHKTLAAGQIPLRTMSRSERDAAGKLIVRRFLQAIKANPRGRKLVE